MPKLSEVFRQAQDHLYLPNVTSSGPFDMPNVTSSGPFDMPIDKHRYICHCISRVVGLNGPRWGEAATDAVLIIQDRLGQHNYFEQWLTAQGVKDVYNEKLMQAHRLAWLKLLEKEYE